jgi:HEAT repeat protein
MPAYDAAPPASEGKRPSDDSPYGRQLPPVEAPTGTFILQLFLIPLLIVSIVVLLWLGFSWLAHMGRDDPQKLVDAIRRGNDGSWQRAYELADLLRSPDPKYDALRSDKKLAESLADLLDRDLKQVASGKSGKPLAMRRMFLCRALGSFDVTTGVPILLKAATLERDPIESEVRLSALEGLATLANNVGGEKLCANPAVMPTLLECSRESDDGSSQRPPPDNDGTISLYQPKSEIRAVAAYALGVIDNDEARERLRAMLHDPYPNARYNAATGLARRGDASAVRVLKEMLDPENDAAIRDENNERDKAQKRTTVLMNGIRAALLYAEANPQAELAELKTALQRLADGKLEKVSIDKSKVQGAALEALRLMEAIPAKPAS